MAQVQILYVATADGLIQLANPGNSDRWRVVDHALAGQDVLAVRASATDALHAFAGASSGLHVTTNGGASWQQDRPEVIPTIAASPDGAIYGGTDGGTILLGGTEDWTEIHTGPAAVKHLSVLADGRIVAVYRNGAVEILDHDTWKSADILVPGTSEVVSSVEKPQELYIGNETSLVTRFGTRTVVGQPTGALVLLPGKPEVLLIGTHDGIQRSDDAGKTLTTVPDGPRNTRVLVTPPRFQDWAYAGTHGGELWVSRDRGRTWTKFHDGMASVRDLSFARVQ